MTRKINLNKDEIDMLNYDNIPNQNEFMKQLWKF